MQQHVLLLLLLVLASRLRPLLRLLLPGTSLLQQQQEQAMQEQQQQHLASLVGHLLRPETPKSHCNRPVAHPMQQQLPTTAAGTLAVLLLLPLLLTVCGSSKAVASWAVVH